MKNIAAPTVKLLAQGQVHTLKEMSGNAGEWLPKHSANLESVVYVVRGQIRFHMEQEPHTMNAGDSLVVPPETWHQIEIVNDFAALHFMPKDIKFKFV